MADPNKPEPTPTPTEGSEGAKPPAKHPPRPRTQSVTKPVEWHWFILGCVFVFAGLAMVFWAFGIGDISPGRRFLLIWMLPLVSGFACGFFAGSLKVSGTWGTLAIAATGGFAVWLLSYFLLIRIPLDEPGHSIRDQAASTGLIALENREDPTTSAPPEAVFDTPEKEIVITGLSCYRTFDIHRDKIKQLIGKNVGVYVMIMDPDSVDLPRVAQRQQGVDIRNDILQTLNRIKTHGLAQSPLFQVRFFQRMPSFTAIMVDGDVLGYDRLADDMRASIRVQPGTEFTPQHKGLIFCFQKVAGKKLGGFDFYARDLRAQWINAEWSDGKVAKLLR